MAPPPVFSDGMLVIDLGATEIVEVSDVIGTVRFEQPCKLTLIGGWAVVEEGGVKHIYAAGNVAVMHVKEP